MIAGAGWRRAPPSDPLTAAAVDPEEARSGAVVSSRLPVSDDGRYLFADVPGPDETDYVPGTEPEMGESGDCFDGFRTVDRLVNVRADCLPRTDESELVPNAKFLGWSDTRTAVVGVLGEGVIPTDYRLVTLGDDGAVTCTGGLPPTSREVAILGLSFDGTAVLFSAEGPAGDELYRHELSGGEPQVTFFEPIEDFNTDTLAYYRVGP